MLTCIKYLYRFDKRLHNADYIIVIILYYGFFCYIRYQMKLINFDEQLQSNGYIERPNVNRMVPLQNISRP